MLTEQEIAKINEILENKKDVDIEIQHRKSGLVILETERRICYRQEDKKAERKIQSAI